MANRWSVAAAVWNLPAAGSETFRPVLRVIPAALDPGRRELSGNIKFRQRAVGILVGNREKQGCPILEFWKTNGGLLALGLEKVYDNVMNDKV